MHQRIRHEKQVNSTQLQDDLATLQWGQTAVGLHDNNGLASTCVVCRVNALDHPAPSASTLV
jgi:hypothetical protein